MNEALNAYVADLPVDKKDITCDFFDAAVCESARSFGIKKVQMKNPGSKQVLVSIQGCGVCNSNLPLWEGREWFEYPLEPGAPGHEAWGVVKTCGSEVSDVKPGQRVTFLSTNAYAQFDIVDEDKLVSLPPQLNHTDLPGEPLGCAINVFRRSKIVSGQTVAVVGTGFLGVLLVKLCSLEGARVIALSKRRTSLEAALNYGAGDVVVLDDYQKALGGLKSITKGQGCDVVIECSGFQMPLDLASETVRTGGKLVIAGYHQDGLRTVDMQKWNWKAIQVINAHERQSSVCIDAMRRAVEQICAGEIQLSSLITHRFPLSEINDAFQILKDRPEGFIKAVVINE